MLTTEPNSWCILILLAFAISLIIRLINSAFRSFEKENKKSFKHVFKGTDDLWLPYFIGALEIIAYSLLLKADLAVYIGAWVTFKTVYKWLYKPETERGLYNRYILSNGLVIISGFLMAKYLYA